MVGIFALLIGACTCVWICAILLVWIRDDWQATMRADDSNNTTDLLRAAASNVRLLSGGSRLKAIGIWIWLAPKLMAYWIRSV
jgi:hypothetical protein